MNSKIIMLLLVLMTVIVGVVAQRSHEWSEINCASCVTTDAIADDNVTAPKLAVDSVGTIAIQDDAVSMDDVGFNFAGSSTKGGSATYALDADKVDGYDASELSGGSGPWANSSTDAYLKDNTSQVGIGIDNATEKLDVRDGVLNIGSGAESTAESGAGLSFGDNGANGYMWMQSWNAKPLALNPSGNNVGIGTTNPNYTLHVKPSSGTAQARIESSIGTNAELHLVVGADNTASKINFGDASDDDIGNILYYHLQDYMKFDVNATERMRITGSGDVGIGETNPQAKLHVLGQIRSSVADDTTAFRITETDGTSNAISFYRDTSESLSINVGAASRTMVITNAGDVGIGTTDPSVQGSIATPTKILHIVPEDESDGTAVLKLGSTSDPNSGNGVVQAGQAGLFSGNKWNWWTLVGMNLVAAYDGSSDYLYTPNSHASIGYQGILFKWNDGIIFYTNQSGSTAGETVNPVARMIVDNDGDVGIGTTSPQRKLVVADDSPIIGLKRNVDGEGWALWSHNANDFFGIYEYTDSEWSTGTTRFTIKAGGNVGIGTINPSEKLEVNGNIHATGNITCDGSCGGGGGGGGEPQGTIIFYNGTSCPEGYEEVTDARGRYLVGLPSGGTLAATAGTALSDQENRAVGQHTHTAQAAGSHSHSYTKAYCDSSKSGTGGPLTCSSSSGATTGSDGSHTHTIDDAGSVAGTNAPYIQFLVCKKITSGGSAAASEGWDYSGNVVHLSNNSNNVGIGTTNPTNKLHVVGDVNITGTLYSGSVGGCKLATYVGATTGSYAGNLDRSGGGDEGAGYFDANAICDTDHPGSHVCTDAEIFESINCGAVTDEQDIAEEGWYNVGSEDNSNCRGWEYGSTYTGFVWGYESNSAFALRRNCGEYHQFLCCG